MSEPVFLKDTRYYCGVDLGQITDYSTVVIVQYDQGDPHYYCRWAERLPLRTPYPVVCDLIAARLRPLRDYLPRLTVDCTGPGLAVTDLMKAKGMRLTPVNITSGFEASQGEKSLHLPKKEIVGNLAVCFQTGKLLISSKVKAAEAMRQELLDFQIRYGRAGHERYEAKRSAVHDDLVIALALALWSAVKHEEHGHVMGLFDYLREKERRDVYRIVTHRKHGKVFEPQYRKGTGDPWRPLARGVLERDPMTFPTREEAEQSVTDDRLWKKINRKFEREQGRSAT